MVAYGTETFAGDATSCAPGSVLTVIAFALVMILGAT